MARKICKMYGNRCIKCEKCIVEMRPWLFEESLNETFFKRDVKENPQKTLDLF